MLPRFTRLEGFGVLPDPSLPRLGKYMEQNESAPLRQSRALSEVFFTRRIFRRWSCPGAGFSHPSSRRSFVPYLRRLDKPALPTYRGKLVLRGLKQTATVRFDRFAIPQVSAANETDLFFVQGFLHAQERLWQMELSRRFLGGRMAEIFGDLPLPWQDLSVQFRRRTSADLDYFMRLLGIRVAAQDSLALLSEDLRARLDAYCAGVNRYIEQCGKKLPWEFRLLRHQPEPWRAEDTLTIGKGLALLLSTALYSRLNFFAVAEKLGDQPAKLQALFPGYPAGAPVIARALWDQAQAVWRFSTGIGGRGRLASRGRRQQ